MLTNVNAVNIQGKPVTKKPYHHGNLAVALVDAAAELVEAEGASAVNLREVARRVGVSAPAVYRHFVDKDALLAAVAARGFARLVTAFEMSQAPDASPLERLRALGMAYVDYAKAHPHLHALMFGPRGPRAHEDPTLGQVAERSFRLLVEAVAACLGPTASERRVLSGAVALWSLVHGYATLHRDGQLAGLPVDLLPDLDQVMTSLILSR